MSKKQKQKKTIDKNKLWGRTLGVCSRAFQTPNVKGETYRCPVVFPENILVDVTKKLLFKLKNNLDGRQERNAAVINMNAKCTV